MGLAKTIDNESEFRKEMPRHAKEVFDHMTRNPVLKLQRWTFARAIVRRPDLATVLFISSSGVRTEIWLSVAPDGDGGWAVLTISKTSPES